MYHGYDAYKKTRDKSMKNRIRNGFITEAGKNTVCFLVTISILVVLFVLSSSIPKYIIRENLLKSANYLDSSEGLVYQLKQGDRRTELHNYADATTLNILYSIDGKDRVKDIFISPFYSDKMDLSKQVTELLIERITYERAADTMYDRYWHGMVLILRPLLTVFTIMQIRWIFLGALLGLMTLLTAMLIKRKQKFLAVLLWLSALAVQLPVIAFCMEYVPVFLLTFLFSVVVIKWENNRDAILRLCIVNGTCVAFFDFLTTETVAFVIPMAIIYCIWNSKGKLKKIKEELVYIIKAGCLWMGSYVMTYLIKWCLASIAHGEERFSVALQQFVGRQGNQVLSYAVDSAENGTVSAEAALNAGGHILPQFFSAVILNIRLLLGLSGKISLEKLALILIFIVFIAVALVYLFRKPGKLGALPFLLFLLGILPMLRMMVLHNHSIEHCFFVYRALYGTIFCFFAGFMELINWDFLRRRKRK